MRFANGEEVRLELVKPAELRWSPNLQLGDLELRGPRGSVRAGLISGQTVNAEMRAQQISSEWFRPVLIFPPTDWGVDSLEADARWTDGPAVFSVRAGVTFIWERIAPRKFSTELKGSADGVDIASLRVAEAGAVIVNAKGRLPVVIRPGGKRKMESSGRYSVHFRCSNVEES